METSDWINLVAAILIGGGTIALAAMTWKSIRKTKELQKRERKERLLNEIIEWAEDIIAWDIDSSYEAKKELEESQEPMWVILLQIGRLSKGYSDYERKGRLYVREYIKFIKDEKLSEHIDSINKELKIQIQIIGNQELVLMKLIRDKATKLSVEFNKAQTDTINHVKIINDFCEKAIEQALKIKVKL